MRFGRLICGLQREREREKRERSVVVQIINDTNHESVSVQHLEAVTFDTDQL